MPHLTRPNGVRIYYEIHGTGTPLILTHGFSSNSSMWQGQIKPLTQAGYQLIIWDMRGHGQSDYPEDQAEYSEAHTVADIAALLDEAGGRGCSAVVGGLSLGGYMSQAFYRDFSERVLGLLIIDTGPGFKSDKARDEWNNYANETAARFDREGLKPLQEASPERAQVSHRNAKGLALAARGMLAQRNSSIIENLPRIKVPSLVVVGADDTPFIAASDYMYKKIPSCEKVEIPSAGHAANIDNPEDFNKAILGFLERLKGGKETGSKSKL